MSKLLYKSKKGKDSPEDSPTVLLIHGLEGIPGTMKVLEIRFLNAGWNVLQFVYPCHKISFYQAAKALAEKLSSLPETQRPQHAVGFSLGGLVLIETLKQWPHIKRNMLLGSPLTSSQAACLTLRVPLLPKLLGPSVQELAKPRSLQLPKSLEFAAIAAKGQLYGSWNPLLPGENDGLVLVEEAIPDKIAQTHVVSALHIELVLRKQIFHLIEHFLSTGTLPRVRSQG